MINKIEAENIKGSLIEQIDKLHKTAAFGNRIELQLNFLIKELESNSKFDVNEVKGEDFDFEYGKSIAYKEVIQKLKTLLEK